MTPAALSSLLPGLDANALNVLSALVRAQGGDPSAPPHPGAGAGASGEEGPEVHSLTSSQTGFSTARSSLSASEGRHSGRAWQLDPNPAGAEAGHAAGSARSDRLAMSADPLSLADDFVRRVDPAGGAQAPAHAPAAAAVAPSSSGDAPPEVQAQQSVMPAAQVAQDVRAARLVEAAAAAAEAPPSAPSSGSGEAADVPVAVAWELPVKQEEGASSTASAPVAEPADLSGGKGGGEVPSAPVAWEIPADSGGGGGGGGGGEGPSSPQRIDPTSAAGPGDPEGPKDPEAASVAHPPAAEDGSPLTLAEAFRRRRGDIAQRSDERAAQARRARERAQAQEAAAASPGRLRRARRTRAKGAAAKATAVGAAGGARRARSQGPRPALLSRLARGERAPVSTSQMRREARRRYESLPEVREAREAQRKQEEVAKRRAEVRQREAEWRRRSAQRGGGLRRGVEAEDRSRSRGRSATREDGARSRRGSSSRAERAAQEPTAMRASHGRQSSSEAGEGEGNIAALAEAVQHDQLPERARWAGAESWGPADIFLM